MSDESLSHSGSALLRWNIGNAVVERRGNAVSITKATAIGAGKIDGLAATLTAIAAYLDAVAKAVETFPEDYVMPVWG